MLEKGVGEVLGVEKLVRGNVLEKSGAKKKRRKEKKKKKKKKQKQRKKECERNLK
ncbi:MAG: hypothetical protein Q9P14_06305 [candidate division KSB1 bacterium]|nr:hypothetical protein [candidate division KSB1 bacterium]